MNKVVFPGLNLTFMFSPIAFTIGAFQIHWYAIAIVFGISLSLVLMFFTKKKYDIKYEDFLEIFVYVIILGIIGARLFFVLFNLNYYINNMNQILNISNGGLAIYGGIILGTFTLYIACKIKKMNFLDVCDYSVPYLALSQGIGRLGNFFNVEAYGKETSNIFRMGIEKANYIEVHPCFAYEMLGCFLICIILKIIQKKQTYKGEILSFYFILYGIIRFFIEGLRSDSLMFFNLKISQIISLIFLIVGISMYINNKLCLKKSKKVD